MQKTWKRETAIGVLLFLGGLTAFAAWALAFFPDAATAPLLVQLVTTIAVPSFGFAALAFGLDWKSKQAPGA